MSTELGVGVIGMGWMGNEHSRAIRQINYAFPDFELNPKLIIVADSVEDKAKEGQQRHGFLEYTTDWQKVINHQMVDVVVVTAPNSMHKEIVLACVSAKKPVFCEKPFGANPTETREIAQAVHQSGIVSGCGFNYRFMPAIQHANNLRKKGELGDPMLLQCFFYARFGDSKDALWSWRFSKELSGTGVVSDVMTHCTDIGHHLNGPIDSVFAQSNTFYTERPYKEGGEQYAKAKIEDLPMRKVTNEDYAAAMVKFRNGSSGFFECSRALYGPKNPFEVRYYGTEGSFRWNFEQMNQIDLDIRSKSLGGYTTVLTGPQFPDHSRLVPGEGTGIGYADSKIFEEARFLKAVVDKTEHKPGAVEAAQVADVLFAVEKSWSSGTWEKINYTFDFK